LSIRLESLLKSTKTDTPRPSSGATVRNMSRVLLVNECYN
jgi:hypothetical protein